MIDKNEFYENSDEPNMQAKRQLWRGIRKEIIPSRDLFSMFDIRSYGLGFATAFLFLFAVIGMYTVGKTLIYENKPNELIINSSYQKAINEFEQLLPIIAKTNNTVQVDEFLQVKQEELKDIDVAIHQYVQEYSKGDLSQIKQDRLRSLYKIKLNVLEGIIAMEGIDYETN